MSVLHYPDSIKAPDVQIWNNEAFDNGDSEDSTVLKPAWWSQSLESSYSKENLNPEISPVAIKSSVSSIPTKPLHSNTVIVNSQVSTTTAQLKVGFGFKNEVQEEEKNHDEKKIDMEIEEIEKEISRLKSRLDALRLEKIERSIKNIERRGKIVPAKFMKQKQSVKIEEPVISSVKPKINRRGQSLGPVEIYSGAKSRLFNKQETATPVSIQSNRRKSCFWKLGEIDELKATKERGKSLSVSPKSRKTVSKIAATKQAVTTIGSKRPVKKQEGIISSIQPKILFKDGEKSVNSTTAKKVIKPGRVVASRYNQIGNASEARKRSWPENEKEEVNKRRASRGSGLNSSQKMVDCSNNSNKVKKKWEIPSEVVVYRSDESPPSASVVADDLPKIRTGRFVNETPRDSGAAKRVADLVGRKFYFSIEEGEEEGDSICQALRFGEEDVEDN